VVAGLTAQAATFAREDVIAALGAGLVGAADRRSDQALLHPEQLRVDQRRSASGRPGTGKTYRPGAPPRRTSELSPLPVTCLATLPRLGLGGGL
jgi:hypothetical protein